MDEAIHYDLDDEPDPERNRWTNAIIGAAIEVHKALGPGHMEETYGNALALEFRLRQIPYQREFPISVSYKGSPVGRGKIDFLVANQIVVEIKAIESLGAIHTAQVISYLRASGFRLGILINFNVRLLKEGIKRIAY